MFDPWYVGVGVESAIPLTGGRVVLWHEESGTLWLAKNRELLFWRSDFKLWYRLSDHRFDDGRITSLGEVGGSVLVELSTGSKLKGKDLTKILSIDPISRWVEELDSVKFRKIPPENIRWTGRRNWKVHEFPRYLPDDFSIFFDRSDGRITDEEHDIFKPVYDCFNEFDRKRYICYPGLGLVVADEYLMRFEVLQLGPAGKDVKGIALDDAGMIWTGGENFGSKSGFSLFDRADGRWKRFDRRLNFGLDSHNARDVQVYDDWVYFATDGGLVCYDRNSDTWRTFDRFDGLRGLDLRALVVGGDFLFIGGDRGLNRFELPEGPVLKTGSEYADELLTGGLAVESDTVWAAGLQGVFRISPNSPPERVMTGGQAVSDEPARSVTVTKNRIWIGTRRSIKEFDKKEWIDHLTSVYINNRRPLALVGNDSLLWIGTERGLYRFNRLRGKWLNYHKSHGLPDNRVQRLVLEADTLWIGTPQGLTRFIWNRPERDGL